MVWLVRFWLVRFWLDHYFQGKNKISFYEKKVVNRTTRVIIESLGLLYYGIIDRNYSISRGGKLSATHAHNFMLV